jgi:hypothetical protein
VSGTDPNFKNFKIELHARIITGTDYNVRSAESLRTLDWDNLEQKS